MNKILDNPDPKALWKMADARIGDRNIGKELLMDCHWNGDIRLDDADAMARFNHYVGRSKMTIIFDGPPGTKLGEGEIDGMHELLADDDFPFWELSRTTEERAWRRRPDATLSAADAAERKVADRIYTALRAGALAADQIADAAHRMMPCPATIKVRTERQSG